MGRVPVRSYMETSITLPNGHEVTAGDVYRLTYDNEQQGLPEGTRLTVERITSATPGTRDVVFDHTLPDGKDALGGYAEGDDTMIEITAMANLLDDGGLVEE